MKKFTRNLCFALASSFMLAGLIGCSSDSKDNSAMLLMMQKPASSVPADQPATDNNDPKPTDAELSRCYIDNSSKKEITFVLSTEKWGITTELTNAHVRGSFNSWSDKDNYKLKKSADGKFYYVTLPYADIKTLGNSGHPEYKFNTDGTDNGYLLAKDKTFIPEPYCFHTSDENLIIIFEGEDIEDIKKCSITAGTWKTLSDWNLETADDDTKEKFANFRRIPGTTCAYRSWHPFKTKYHKDGGTKYLRDTEPKRVEMVTSLYRKYDIKTDICLSGDETKSLSTYPLGSATGEDYKESVPEYYKALVDAGNVCNVKYHDPKTDKDLTPEYKYIYQADFNPTYLNGWLKDIAKFISDDSHPAPYNVHCRLGNDRTGYYCAILAGLCGATWEQIAADYQKSNNTFLGEYRDQRLLKMVFEKQFGVEDISKVSNLKELMMDYYEKDGSIPTGDLTKMVEKLTKKINCD